MAQEMEKLPKEDGLTGNEENTLNTENSEATISTENDVKTDLTETSLDENKKKDVPVIDYKTLSIQEMVEEFKSLSRNYEPNQVKNQTNEIREQYKLKVEEDRQQKENEFISSGGEKEAFAYNNPYHNEFYTLVGDFKAKLHAYYKNIEKQQKENLKERLLIIEELKALYLNQDPDHHHTFKQFRSLRDRWDNAGFVPKNDVSNVFKTYYHHLDNYYEYLKLNRGLEELEHKNNLELKEQLIFRAKQLQDESNLQNAFTELQFLHNKWKEIGPIDREIRDQKWQEFKEVTKVVHDRKQELNDQYRIEQTNNLEKKKEIILLINQLTQKEINSHQKWQQKIKLLEELRNAFMKTGRVPKEFNDGIWDDFKQSTRDFNHKKNHYYKSLKNDQQNNLDLKNALLEEAKGLQESTDWESTTKKLIDIQAKWKKIGHVPRKYSDKIWQEFKSTCNNFFDRYHALENEKEQAFVDNYQKKLAFIEEIKHTKIEGDSKEAISIINDFSNKWKTLGKVPKNKMSINKDFDKAINNLLSGLNISKVELEDVKLDNLISQIISNEDQYLLNDEVNRARKKIQELEQEIAQLETNLGFFSNAADDNPLLKNTKDNINKFKEEHLIWSKRYSKLIKVHFEKLDNI